MSQIPNYFSFEPSQAQTEQKIRILEKKDATLGKVARSLFGIKGEVVGSIDTSLQELDKETADRLRGLFSQEILLAGGTSTSVTAGGSSTGAGSSAGGGGSVGGIASGITGSIRGFADRVDTSISNQIQNINEHFKPVSRELGQTLGNISRFIGDPAGTLALIPGSLKNVIERNNPGFAADLEATYKKFHIDTLVHIPSMVVGSITNLVTGLDAILTLPVIIITDLYQGLLDIINEISDAVDKIVASFVKKIFTEFLDGLLLDILKILEYVVELAGYIGGIAALSLGANPITQYANLVQTYGGALGSFINNPLDTLFAYAPPQVSQALYLLRNPQQMVNNLLPPQLTEGFAKLASITGFGFNGNMGYGFVSVLQGLRGGVISSILTNFSAKYPILTPLLGKLNAAASTSNTPAPPTVTAPPVAPDNSLIQTGKNGSQVVQREPENVILTKEDVAYITGINLNQGQGPTVQAAAAAAANASVNQAIADSVLGGTSATAILNAGTSVPGAAGTVGVANRYLEPGIYPPKPK